MARSCCSVTTSTRTASPTPSEADLRAGGISAACIVGLEAVGTVEAEILLIEIGVNLGLVFTRDFQFTGAPGAQW